MNINFEDLQQLIQQQMKGKDFINVEITTEKLDEFIKKCCQRDETLVTLSQSLKWSLEQALMISIPEAQVYPVVLQRIYYWINQGKTILE